MGGNAEYRPQLFWNLLIEAEYCAHLSIEGEMLGVQHVFLSKSEFSSRVCLGSSTSPCNEISDCQRLCIRCYRDTTFPDSLQLKSYREKNLILCNLEQSGRYPFWRTPEPLFSTRQGHRSKQSIVFHNTPDIAKRKERLP